MGGVNTSGSPQAVFRVSRLTVLFALALALVAMPVAFGAPYLWLVYLLPVAVVVWTFRSRTVADADGLHVRRVVGSREVPWTALKGLRVDKRAGVHAVLADGGELTLPAVHVRDLPALAAASGGHVPDPSTD